MTKIRATVTREVKADRHLMPKCGIPPDCQASTRTYDFAAMSAFSCYIKPNKTKLLRFEEKFRGFQKKNTPPSISVHPHSRLGLCNVGPLRVIAHVEHSVTPSVDA